MTFSQRHAAERQAIKQVDSGESPEDRTKARAA
jgi:hypothetical protein